jgi:hypothetical protein
MTDRHVIHVDGQLPHGQSRMGVAGNVLAEPPRHSMAAFLGLANKFH